VVAAEAPAIASKELKEIDPTGVAMEAQSDRNKVYPVTAGQYKLLEEIGHGLGSTVYRAICLLYNEVVAVKTMDLESSNANLVNIHSTHWVFFLLFHFDFFGSPVQGAYHIYLRIPIFVKMEKLAFFQRFVWSLRSVPVYRALCT